MRCLCAPLSGRCTFAAAQTYALEQIGGKPAFIEEHGSRRQEQTSQNGVATYMRTLLWNAWSIDCKAMLWWCAYDQTGMTIAPYNWRQPCVELGIFRRDRTPYPAVTTMRKFIEMQERLPFESLPRAKTDAVVLTTDSAVIHSSYILARQAGIMPRFASPEGPLPDADCYFLPNAQGRAYLSIERWEELKTKVRDGATLYLSWNDTFLDSMEEVAGVEVSFREKRGGMDVCDFGDFKVEVPYSVKRRFNALTAKTLAKNQNGEGVFFRNAYGKGSVFLFVHNFERTFYESAGRYESDGCRIWAKVLPVSRVVETNDRNIFVSEHPFGDGRVGVILVNNSRDRFEGKVKLCDGWTVHDSATDDLSCAKFGDGNRLALSGNAGILLIASRVALAK